MPKELAQLSAVLGRVLPYVDLCWHQGLFDVGKELNHEKTNSV